MKILIVQTWGLGNAINTTPLIQTLATMGESKRRMNEVHVAVKRSRKAGATVLAGCPGVKKTWDVSQAIEIVKQRFDLLVLCSESTGLANLYRIPRLEVAYLLKDQGELYPHWYARHSKHEMEMMFDVARAFGFKGPMPAPYLPVNRDIKLDHHGLKVAFGIGYYKREKRNWKKHWGNPKFIELARRLPALGGTAFLVGDTEDQKVDGGAIEARSRGTAVSLCGKLGLEGMIGALAQCDMYVGNDTGLTHAAAALGLPTLAIFKPWASSFIKSRPWGDKCDYTCEWPKIDVLEAVWRWIVGVTQALKQESEKPDAT